VASRTAREILLLQSVQLALEASPRSLAHRDKVEPVPEVIGWKVVATVQHNAASLRMISRINQFPSYAITLVLSSDDEVHDADLVAREIVKNVASHIVVLRCNDQRALVCSLRERGVRQEAYGSARCLC
jgi:hypothetical protein